jgi:hypothetical protein
MHLRLFIQRSLIGAVSCMALLWGGFALPTSGAADDFRYLETRLLHPDTFDPNILALRLESSAAKALSDCDSHAQTALLLTEMRLAEAALRAGELADFDKRSLSMEVRAKQVLGCIPRDSYVWLLAFSVYVLHGQLNEQTFKFLAMSYDTSPNEAWIAIRRNIVALPLALVVPQPLQDKILTEFQQLLRNGFRHEAALSYSGASAAVQSLLRPRIGQLDADLQKSLWDEIARNYSHRDRS